MVPHHLRITLHVKLSGSRRMGVQGWLGNSALKFNEYWLKIDWEISEAIYHGQCEFHYILQPSVPILVKSKIIITVGGRWSSRGELMEIRSATKAKKPMIAAEVLLYGCIDVVL